MRALITRLVLTVAIAAGFATQVQAEHLSLYVVNNASETLTNFYMLRVGVSGWGPDLLGSSVIYSGNSQWVNPGQQQGYCMMDWLAIWDDGDELSGQINACDETEIVFQD